MKEHGKADDQVFIGGLQRFQRMIPYIEYVIGIILQNPIIGFISGRISVNMGSALCNWQIKPLIPNENIVKRAGLILSAGQSPNSSRLFRAACNVS